MSDVSVPMAIVDFIPVALFFSAFVDEHRRHNTAPQGRQFSIGLWADDRLTGIVIVGRPVARTQDDGMTAEVSRCCVLDDAPNANSMLYAAAWRAAKAMGYRRMITYTPAP